MTSFPIILQRPPTGRRIPIVSGGGGDAYSAVAATFDGTNDYMARGAELTGAVDSKKGIFSCWVKFNGNDNEYLSLLCSVNFNVRFYRKSDNTISVVLYNSASATILNLITASTYIASATWRHILISWDLATPNARHLYINDTDDITVSIFTNDNIDYTTTNYFVGIYGNITSFKLNGCLSELYFNIAEYLDFSIVANRRKFIDASGAPVSLGADGSTPTGSIPIIYLKNAYDSFSTNSGSGGNFTVTGALTECADPPP